MPINGLHSSHAPPSSLSVSRLTSATISSSAKWRSGSALMSVSSVSSNGSTGSATSPPAIMGRTSNLTRTRSLRIPHRSTQHLLNTSVDSDDTKTSELKQRVRELETKIKELENEKKESKESIEFLTSEGSVLADSLKEAEEKLFKERLYWIKEKKTFDKVMVWSKNVYLKIKEKSEKIKQMETEMSDKDKQVEQLVQQNKNYEIYAQNSSKILNKIREKIVIQLSNDKTIEKSVIIPKLWPQIDSSNLTNCNDITLDDSIVDDIFNGNQYFSKDCDELKHNTNEIIKENALLRRALNEKELVIDEKNEFFERLKSESETNSRKMFQLSNELDVLTEKYRCSESVNRELRQMLEKSDSNRSPSDNIVESLRIENVSIKESLALKEEMIERLGSKYARNRKVWEENEKKATQEIKKLDDLVDHVIDTLKSLPENYRNLGAIQEILDLLTDDTIPQSK